MLKHDLSVFLTVTQSSTRGRKSGQRASPPQSCETAHQLQGLQHAAHTLNHSACPPRSFVVVTRPSARVLAPELQQQGSQAKSLLLSRTRAQLRQTHALHPRRVQGARNTAAQGCLETPAKSCAAACQAVTRRESRCPEALCRLCLLHAAELVPSGRPCKRKSCRPHTQGRRALDLLTEKAAARRASLRLRSPLGLLRLWQPPPAAPQPAAKHQV